MTRKIVSLTLHAIAFVFALLMLFPLVWMLVNSFRPTEDILGYPLALWKGHFNLSAYLQLGQISGMSLWSYVYNSFLITIGTTFLILFFTSLGAYALYQRPLLRVFRWLEVLFLGSIMYPGILMMIPLYFIGFSLHLLGTYAGIILALAGGAWGAAVPFFLFRQFFQKIPQELLEAASIDGTNSFQTFLRIVFPMSLPVYGTAALITFMSTWGAWFPVLVMSSDSSTYTLSAALVNVNSELGIQFQTTMALSTLITLPVLLIFILTQKSTMEGMAQGSVKG